ncbi:MAG: argininosuccinate lyase [Dehalococcoidia bacterium]
MARKGKSGRGGTAGGPRRGVPGAEQQAGSADKRWGGRFEKRTNPLAELYSSSIEQDEMLLKHDIAGSIAHAHMLGQQEIISHSDAQAIIAGLTQIELDYGDGKFELREDLEDVHMNVEAELERRIGKAAGRLHTARSRNDQVATDFRLAVIEYAESIEVLLLALQQTLVDLAEQHIDTVMPGYTHMQLAQPVLLAHHLLAYREMFRRDTMRFGAVIEGADSLPLGSGALAGLPYPIDREQTAESLGFSTISANSMDAVSDRDFVIEFHAAAAICMMHVSRLAEELILWSTREFGFITFDDAFATGSSIMPQKKNPDIAELARGKTGAVYGNLINALTMMKGLPLTYNRDLQEDKAPVFSSVYTLSSTLGVFIEMLPTVTWHVDRLREAAGAGYSLATDIADYLVRKELPFREAHAVVGRLVRYAESQRKEFSELSLEEYRQFSTLFAADVLEITLDTAIDARDVVGGTARNQVRDQIALARVYLQEAAQDWALDNDDDDAVDEQPHGLLRLPTRPPADRGGRGR